MSNTPVSSADIESFKTNGYLIRRGILERDELATAMNQIWRYLHAELTRNRDATSAGEDPGYSDSWRDPQWTRRFKAATSGFYEGRPPIVADGPTVKLHDLGSAEFILDLVVRNEAIRHVARQLLDENLRPSERTRGVYALFPNSKPLKEQRLGPHSDRVCQQLNVCVYLEDVPSSNGGFTVWPGSHQVMYRAHKFDANWSPTSSFRDLIAQVARQIDPFEFVGHAGDVLYWHGRMVHSAGIHTGDRIRWAIFGDFSQDRPVLSPDEHRAVGQYEWFKDTKLFREDLAASTGDMWRNWRLASELD